MPKKLKRMVYGGPAEELALDFGKKKVVLKRNIATIVTDDEFEFLKGCKRKLNLLPVLGVEDSYTNKLKNRILRED